ncbi:fg-gap repeat protein [Nitritalea halalkaliphila LW7]|uniref:Fg-gap repeat protein n=1 Tax=Nitritalea halalkaliphila LW7 TaxID=1189621 RepID=I5C9V6_9BACT|nr:VCBS repeat-containing protein [Nitritalea halalkaliphila]EIM78608.1 fg-gap repeat protein [Nitritalea halalkaliphila LW7]
MAVGDVNGDGWPDLYVSNDFTEDDYLYINNKDGTFTERRAEKLSQTSRYSMGNDIADLNQDGLPDIFSTDMLPADPEIWMRSVGEDKQEVFEIKERMGYGAQYVRNHLQLNHPDGRFREIALLTETFATDWSWSPLLADLDNDGRVDIFVSNGIYLRPNDLDFIQYGQGQVRAEEAADFQAQQIALLPKDKLPNFLFAQRADLRFEEQQREWGLGAESYSSGAMYADLDNDGDLDLVLNNVNQAAFLYENRSRQLTDPGHFVQLQLRGAGLNPFAVGAEVLLALADGSWRHAYHSTSRGFQSGASTRLHVGIGAAQEVEGLWVRWSATEAERFSVPALDSLLVLEKGTGTQEAFPNRFLLEASPVIRQAQVALDWRHEENDFNDFRREYLIPRRYSQEGPAVAVADVNGDGLEDIFLGGARGQAAKLFLQEPDGSFTPQTVPVFEQMAEAEDVVAIFHDFTGNGVPDLYVGSGGNEHGKTAVFNFDRVFINDGSGRFTFLPQALPPIAENTATVAVSDVNGDGYPDLFIGVAVETGNFGQRPPAFLLLNQGNGTFRDATAQYFGPDFRPGMLQKALWEDLNGDGKLELLLAGEYMAVTAYRQNESGQFVRWKELAPAGLYSGMRVQELEGANYLLLGNLGLNAKLKASDARPAYLYTGDLDQNGKREAFLMHHKGDALVPFSSRDELITVMPALKRQHASYAAYAQSKGPEAIFTPEQLARVEEFPIRELRSGMLALGLDTAAFEALPLEAQFSPIQDFFPFQVDGVPYMLALGNFYAYRVDLGRADAQALSLWSWQNGAWKKESHGLQASRYWGSFRQAVGIQIGGRPHVLLVRNDDTPLFLRLEGTEVLY